MSEPLFVIRPADWNIPGERNMVRKTWIKSYSSSAIARVAGRSVYYSGQHDLVDRLLDSCEVRVACSPRVKETIIGWACLAPPKTVHYVFVVEDFRRHGVAAALLDGLDERATYTHRNDLCRELKIPERWHFDFYALMRAP